MDRSKPPSSAKRGRDSSLSPSDAPRKKTIRAAAAAPPTFGAATEDVAMADSDSNASSSAAAESSNSSGDSQAVSISSAAAPPLSHRRGRAVTGTRQEAIGSVLGTRTDALGSLRDLGSALPAPGLAEVPFGLTPGTSPADLYGAGTFACRAPASLCSLGHIDEFPAHGRGPAAYSQVDGGSFAGPSTAHYMSWGTEMPGGGMLGGSDSRDPSNNTGMAMRQARETSAGKGMLGGLDSCLSTTIDGGRMSGHSFASFSIRDTSAAARGAKDDRTTSSRLPPTPNPSDSVSRTRTPSTPFTPPRHLPTRNIWDDAPSAPSAPSAQDRLFSRSSARRPDPTSSPTHRSLVGAPSSFAARLAALGPADFSVARGNVAAGGATQAETVAVAGFGSSGFAVGPQGLNGLNADGSLPGPSSAASVARDRGSGQRRSVPSSDKKEEVEADEDAEIED